jgi:hypothetical protein
VNVAWEAPAKAAKFLLSKSRDGGKTWLRLARRPVTGTSLAWKLPATNRNVPWRVKVVGLTKGGARVGSSAGRKFTVGALRVTWPDGGEQLSSGTSYPVSWKTAPGKAATGGKVWFSANGGKTWSLAGSFTGDPGIYDWTPSVAASKTVCQIRVDLFGGGRRIGADASNGSFTVNP